MIGLFAPEARADVAAFGGPVGGGGLKPLAEAFAVAGFALPFGCAAGAAVVFGASFASGVRAIAVPRFFLARPSATSVGCGEVGRTPTHTGTGTEACSGPSSGPVVARPRRLC